MKIPPYLHEVFGESQTLGEIMTILLFGTGVPALLFVIFPEMTQGIPLWRNILAFLLILDIAAGCIANFTRSTSDYYATRDKQRLVFIAIHVHILVVAWLLGIDLGYAIIVWAYTIISAFIVNAYKGSPFQLFLGGTLLAICIPVVVLTADVPKYFLVISLLFMLKVLFSFAVDHYHRAQTN